MLELKEDEINIEDVINKNKQENILSFFYFTAKWCNPCKEIYPYIELLNEKFIENKKKMKIYKIDIDINDEFSRKCGIRSVPSFIIMDGLNIISSCSGSDFDKLSDMIIKTYNKYITIT